jgi:hypothetical protein
LCGGACNRILIISGFLEYFPYLLFNFSTCNLCLQVENSSTAQVGGPHDAADVVEPVLAGSDVPLPEDGFTHEVNCFNLPYSESRISNAFSFRLLMLINADFFLVHSSVCFCFRILLGAAFEALIDTVP